MAKEKICYVIMPFSKLGKVSENKWTETFEELFKPAVEESGLNYKCVRSTIRNGSFTKDILENLKNAKVVLADISGVNPNVMWELGVRHTFSRRTILVVRKDFSTERIVSDLKNYGVIDYSLAPLKNVNAFKKKIKELLEGIEHEPERNDSPVFDFLKDEELVMSSIHKQELISNLKGLISELSYNLKFAEEIDLKEENVALTTTTLKRFKTSASNYLLSTYYLPVPNQYYQDIRFHVTRTESTNHRIDLVMLDKRFGKDFKHTEEIEKQAKIIIDNTKQIIKTSSKILSNIQKGTLEMNEVPIVIADESHKALIE